MPAGEVVALGASARRAARVANTNELVVRDDSGPAERPEPPLEVLDVLRGHVWTVPAGIRDDTRRTRRPRGAPVQRVRAQPAGSLTRAPSSPMIPQFSGRIGTNAHHASIGQRICAKCSPGATSVNERGGDGVGSSVTWSTASAERVANARLMC